MKKLIYKPIAIQNECFGGTEKSPELVCIIKKEAVGTKKMYYKNEVIEFPNRMFLDDYIKRNKLKILSEQDFKALPSEKALQLIKAL
jgi:hypothetical protein